MSSNSSNTTNLTSNTKSPSTRSRQAKYSKISAAACDSSSAHDIQIAKDSQSFTSSPTTSLSTSSDSTLCKPDHKCPKLSPEDQIRVEAEEVDLTFSDTESALNVLQPSIPESLAPVIANGPSHTANHLRESSDSQSNLNLPPFNSDLSTSSPETSSFNTVLSTASNLFTQPGPDESGSVIVKNEGEIYFRHASKNINSIKPSSIKISDWIDLGNTEYLLVRPLKVKTNGAPTPAGTKRHERSLYVVGRVDDCFLDKPSSVNEKDTPTWTISLGISMDSYKSLKAITGTSPDPIKVNSKSDPLQIFYPFNMFRERCSDKFRQKITRFTAKSSDSAKDRSLTEEEGGANDNEPEIDYTSAPFPSIYDSAHLSINPGCFLPELASTSHLNLLPKSLAAVEFTITYWTFTLKTGYLKQGYSFWLQSVHHLNDSSAHVIDLQNVQPSILQEKVDFTTAMSVKVVQKAVIFLKSSDKTSTV